MIVRFHRENEGLLPAEDLETFRVGIEPPVRSRFDDMDGYACGPWCQGPMLLQSLNLLDGKHLRQLGHNLVTYIPTVTEAIKLAAADREAYYGDPHFVEVPMAQLLSQRYSVRRRGMIHPDKAWPELPPPGEVTGGVGPRRGTRRPAGGR